MSGFGGRGLAPGRIDGRRVHQPGPSRGPSATRSATGRGAKPFPPDQSVTRRKGVARRLKAIEPVIRSLASDRDDWAYNRPTLDHRLSVWVTPVGGWGSPSTEIRERGRYGLGGLTSTGKKEVSRTLELMDQMPGAVALWTVSLPDEDYLDLKESGQWPVFQRALVDGVTRHLKANGDPALVVAVAELGLKRQQRTGRPMPHIHMGLSGWGRRDHTGQWLLRPDVMDGLLLEACRKAGLSDRYRAPGSKIEKVEKSISAYLGPYLRKGCDPAEWDTSDGWDALIPHQWWNRSKAAKALRDGHVWKLPVAFAAFVETQRRRLEALGLGLARLVSVGRRVTKTSDRSIDVICFTFASVEHLQQAFEWFVVWCADRSAMEREADRCTSLRTLACDGADVGSTAAAPPQVLFFPGSVTRMFLRSPVSFEVLFPGCALGVAAGSPVVSA